MKLQELQKQALQLPISDRCQLVQIIANPPFKHPVSLKPSFPWSHLPYPQYVKS